jgi:O-antigen ligase
VPAAGGFVLAASLPPLFLHVRYQPSFDLAVAGTSVTVTLADFAVLAVAGTAAAVGQSTRFADLRRTPAIWIAAVALLAVILASTFYGGVRDERYSLVEHLVTALKFAEYAVLAPAAALLLRGRRDVLVLLGAVAAWSTVASTVGLLQFLGFVDQFAGRRPGRREPSWIGEHDFAALSGAAIVVAFLAIALGPVERRHRVIAALAGIAGSVGLVLAAALDAIAAMLVTALLFGLLGVRLRRLAARRAAALASIALLVTAAALMLRAADLDQFLRFLGIRPAEAVTRAEVQTHAHRTVLAYIGMRIFLDDPVFGVGWQASADEYVYGEYLDDARARFPDQPARVFPSPAHPWGVQNAFVQALADMGVIGLLALLGVFAAGFAVCFRPALRAPPAALVPRLAVSWLLFAGAGLAALGLFAGAPVHALLWLSVGMAVVAARDGAAA